jgi:hypothetical protein
MQLGVHNTAIRNYWWISSLGGLYFVGGFILWGGTRASMISASIFVIVGVIGLVVHYRAASMSRETICRFPTIRQPATPKSATISSTSCRR